MNTGTTTNVTYLNAEQSALLDKELMGDNYGFINEQLMENAGISTSHAVIDFLQNHSASKPSYNVLVVCGPGNNGGDGLVAARHLKHFGVNVTVCYPRSTTNTLFLNLLKQMKNLRIETLEHLQKQAQIDNEFDLIVDAIFGYSFKGTSLREPFQSVIRELKTCSTPILSIDVPSGWDVDHGNVNDLGLNADALVSLPVPKLCAKNFCGVHYVGGRFVPPVLAEQLNITLPVYNGIDTIVKL